MLTTFLGVARESWSVWASWAGVAATLLVGGGAVWIAKSQLGALREEAEEAQKSSRAQLEAIERQISVSAHAAAAQLREMEAARLESIRPFVTASSADLRVLDTARVTALRVRFENSGGGPALGIECDCWWKPMPNALVRDEASLLDLAQRSLTGPPMGQIHVPTPIRAGEARVGWVTAVGDGAMYPLDFSDSIVLVLMRGTYRGLNETVFALPEGKQPFANVVAVFRGSRP